MSTVLYTDEQFALYTANGTDLGQTWVALEVDFFRDGQWTIEAVGLVSGYVRDEDGACLQPLREIVEWDIPADLADRIKHQALTRYRNAINEYVWDITREVA